MSRRPVATAQATPEVVLPPALPPSEIVLKLRKDVRMAQISQFVLMFGPHVNLDFDIDDLESDLDGSRPGCCIPTLLGKLCNTLANDRNTNSSNWMQALRRAYNRRFPKEENPFYRYVRVPITTEENNKDGSALANDGEKMEADSQQQDQPTATSNDAPLVKADPEADADASTSLNSNLAPPAEHTASTSNDTLATPLASTSTAPATPALLQSVSVKLERDATDGLDTREGSAAAYGAGADTGDLDYYEDRIDVEWTEVDLETKVSAIFNICQWHMDDAERFRRHLKYEDDLSWRIEPIGTDGKQNEYYFLDDHRLWIHRAPPPRRAPKKAAAAKSKGKGKAKGKAKANPAPPKPKPAPKKRARSPDPALEPVVSPSKRSRTTRGRVDDWEPIPEELLKEWEHVAKQEKEAGPSRQKREASSGASSALTSLGDEAEQRGEEEQEEEEEEEEEKKPAARPRPKYKKDDIESDIEEEEEPAEEVESEVEEPESEHDEGSASEGDKGEGDDGTMKWDRDFWAEREQIEALEGFVEWETICVTRKEWEDFVESLSSTKNKNERRLRDLIKEDLLPEVIAGIEHTEKARLAELIAMNRKRSTRIATMESEEEEKARLAAERAAESAKLSRASRHKIIANLNINGDDSTSDGGSTGKGGVQETREERLKKRAEEKAAREAALEAAQIEQIKKMEREAAIAANDGVVPPGMETEEELQAMRVEEEKEARRVAKEQARLEKEAEARQQQTQRGKGGKAVKAEPPPAPVFIEQVSDEPPWYLDCEICKDAGWNLDDGQDVIACDRCDEWQHLQCHVKANAIPGKPPIDFSADDFSFICTRCRANPTRQKRIPPADLPPPRVYVPAPPPPPPAKKGRPKKAPPPPPKSAPPRPTPEERKAQRGKLPAPAAAPPARSASTNGSSSTRAPAAAPAAASSSSSGIPGPGQPPLSYDALKALIEAQPVLINQLPPQYQTHFSGLLGIPVPYPTNGSPAPPAASMV